MPSGAEIASLALNLIGSKPILSLDPPDDEERARVAAQWFVPSRDATLRASDWNFAKKRVSLAADATAPVFGKLRAFTLPNDCLRPLLCNGQQREDDYAWEVEGRKIHTDLTSPLEVLYIKKAEDPEEWDPLFVQAFTHYLASKMAKRLTGSADEGARQLALHLELVGDAKSANGMERTEIDTDSNVQDTWLNAREGAARPWRY